jgi:hypothetical protein
VYITGEALYLLKGCVFWKCALLQVVEWLVLPLIVIAGFLLIGLFVLNLVVVIGRLMSGMAAWVLSKVAGVAEDELWPHLTGGKRWLQRGFTVSWLLVGVVSCWLLVVPDEPLLLLLPSYLVLFFAFRSGANLSHRLILGYHDQRVLRRIAGGDSTRWRVFSRTVLWAIVLGLVATILFVSLWSVIYLLFSSGLRMAAGLGFNSSMLILWGSGIVFGTIYGFVFIRGVPFLLLKNEIAVVSLLTLRGPARQLRQLETDIQAHSKRAVERTKATMIAGVDKIRQIKETASKRIKSFDEEEDPTT